MCHSLSAEVFDITKLNFLTGPWGLKGANACAMGRYPRVSAMDNGIASRLSTFLKTTPGTTVLNNSSSMSKTKASAAEFRSRSSI